MAYAVLEGPTMSLRTATATTAVTAVLALATLPGCPAPRTGIVIGATTTLVGGVALASVSSCGDGLGGLVCGSAYAGGGAALVGLGLTLLTTGLVGLAME